MREGRLVSLAGVKSSQVGPDRGLTLIGPLWIHKRGSEGGKRSGWIPRSGTQSIVVSTLSWSFVTWESSEDPGRVEGKARWADFHILIWSSQPIPQLKSFWYYSTGMRELTVIIGWPKFL